MPSSLLHAGTVRARAARNENRESTRGVYHGERLVRTFCKAL